MKGMKTWIWIAYLCLGITLTVSTPQITQSLFSSSSNKVTTNSSSFSDLLRRHFPIPQLFARIMSHHDKHDNVTGHYKTVNGSMNLVAIPTNGTLSVPTLGKRSVKRGEVNYFENLTNQPMPSKDLFKKLNLSRHKRMAKRTSKSADESEQGRKKEIQQEADYRRKESAVRRKEVREEKLSKTKSRRVLLKNSRKTPGTLHVREKQSISGKMRENRVKMRDNNGSHRPSLTKAKAKYRSSAHIGLLSKRKSRLNEKGGQYGKNKCKKSVIEKKHKSSLTLREKNCITRGNKRNLNGDQSKGLATEHSARAFDDTSKSRHSKSSSDSENKNTKKKIKHSEKNSEEDEKSKVTDNGRKKKIDNKKVRKKPASDHRKSRKSKGLDNDDAVSKSSSRTAHRSTGKHKNKNIAKEADKHKHSDRNGQESVSKKKSKNKRIHQKGGSKNKKIQKKTKSQKGGKDEEERDEEKFVLGKGGKLNKSKIKSTKKHISVVSDDSEEKSNDGDASSQKHKYKKQEERKQSQGKVRKSKGLKKDSENDDGESSSAAKSSKRKAVHSVEKSKSATITEKSREVDKKLKPVHENNEVKKKKDKGSQVKKSKKGITTKGMSAGRSEDENQVNDVEYLGNVLGLGLGNRKRLQSKSRTWSRRVHKRPVTGGYASSGRLTRALSNLYGASASAGF